jgi:hypothetical protein
VCSCSSTRVFVATVDVSICPLDVEHHTQQHVLYCEGPRIVELAYHGVLIEVRLVRHSAACALDLSWCHLQTRNEVNECCFMSR